MGIVVSIFVSLATAVLNLLLFCFRLLADLVMWIIDLFRRR